MKKIAFLMFFGSFAFSLLSCEKEKSTVVVQDDKKLNELSVRIGELEEELKKEQAESSRLSTEIANNGFPLDDREKFEAEIAKLQIELQAASAQTQEVRQVGEGRESTLNSTISELRKKLQDKIRARSLAQVNLERLSAKDALLGHSPLLKFEGDYNVLVIPVEFSDVEFTDHVYYENNNGQPSKAQEMLFGDNQNSMTQHYKHLSLGKLNINGRVLSPIKVTGSQASYGGNNEGGNDINPRGLVAETLKIIRDNAENNPEFIIDWEKYDNWDIGDWDRDGNYYEPDGFADAVVFVYAGKAESSCSGLFPSDLTQDDRRYEASIACANTIWPHRSRLFITNPQDPDFSEVGPMVEGIRRPALGGLKLSDTVFASDYNMQSEYSDISTFVHEFGHSLGLPDIYAIGGANNVATWELMARDSVQELSTFSKLTLGWLEPKVVRQGEQFSGYLGSYGFVANDRRENSKTFAGPKSVTQEIDGKLVNYDVLSTVPENDEPVYRSMIALPKAKSEKQQLRILPASFGSTTAYSDKFDADNRYLELKVNVPTEGDVTLTFDTVYGIETETNFDNLAAGQEDVQVVVDYDLGYVAIDDVIIEQLRLFSGDENFDSLVEKNENCDANLVLELRRKIINLTASEEDLAAFQPAVALCREPVDVTKSYDLSQFRGKTVTLKIGLETDANTTEIGLFVDNVKLGGKVLEDFEFGDTGANGFIPSYQGVIDVVSSQFYMFEYRDPQADYKGLSYNQDANMADFSWSMFTDRPQPEVAEEVDAPVFSDLDQRYRMIQQKTQPGVLVWYFNSKFGRRENSASTQNGQGYLLVVNSNPQDSKFPGVYDKPEFRDANGLYDHSNPDLVNTYLAQVQEYTCFANKAFTDRYGEEETDCSDISQIDQINKLTFNGLPLRAGFEMVNELLPEFRNGFHDITGTYPNSVEARTRYATFRPQTAGPFKPFEIFKSDGTGALVLDEEMTNAAPNYAPASVFNDKTSLASELPRLASDHVRVEPSGFGFEVTEPLKRIKDRYDNQTDANANNSIMRAPKAKVYFNWQ